MNVPGRRTYDLSVPWWGADGPSGAARVPVFVVTHAEPEDAPEGGVYTFVTDGIQSALEQAKATAGEKDVALMGGAQIGQQQVQQSIDELVDSGAERGLQVAEIVANAVAES